MLHLNEIPVFKLIGLELNGFFQRDLKLVEESREHREELKRERPSLLGEYDKEWGSSDIEDAFIDRKYEFRAKILDFDPKSGLFIARGYDMMGDSGLVGMINEQNSEIIFNKIYEGHKPTDLLRLGLGRFRNIKYHGNINIGATNSGAYFSCGGKYQPSNTSENYRGFWHLSSRDGKL